MQTPTLPSSIPQPVEKVVDALLEATIVPSFTKIGPKVRSRVGDWAEHPPVIGLRVLLTGGTSGIGREVVQTLVEHGADVILTSRSQDRADKAVTEIVAEAAVGGRSPGEARGMALDTADFDSINRLVDQLKDEPPLDVVIHNAGALTAEYRANAQGIEATLASHLVGPYHLTMSLLPHLAKPARVLWMSSGGMYTQGLDVDRLEMTAENYRGSVAYARAKRGQVELVSRLAPRLAPDVIMHAMHPGWVATEGVDQGLPGFSKLMGPLLRDPSEGADTMVWLAAGGADDAEPGSFFLDRRRRRTVYLPGTSTTDAERQALLDRLDALTASAADPS